MPGALPWRSSEELPQLLVDRISFPFCLPFSNKLICGFVELCSLCLMAAETTLQLTEASPFHEVPFTNC